MRVDDKEQSPTIFFYFYILIFKRRLSEVDKIFDWHDIYSKFINHLAKYIAALSLHLIGTVHEACIPYYLIDHVGRCEYFTELKNKLQNIFIELRIKKLGEEEWDYKFKTLSTESFKVLN